MPALSPLLSAWCVALCTACASLLSACVVVPAGNLPGPAAVPAATVAVLKPGTSSRVDVLMTLGDPDYRYAADRAFAYRWSETLAWVIFGGGYRAAGFPIDEMRMLMIEFGDDGSVTRLDIVNGVLSSTFNKAVDEWLGKVQGGRP
jgi:outer membrane protein assembly factor BamE (lipoprotein component of BamABCDE complex)